MRTLITSLLGCLCLLLPLTASAEVYKCQEGGKLVFSDKPCGSDARPVDVRPATGPWNEEAAARRKAELEQLRTLRESSELDRELRSIDDDISRKQGEVARLESRMNEELDALRDKKRYARNNLAGAVWEQSISEEMNAVSSNYQARIRNLQVDIDRLLDRRDRLTRP